MITYKISVKDGYMVDSDLPHTVSLIKRGQAAVAQASH